jgi:ATP-binding cassette subfamily B protein
VIGDVVLALRRDAFASTVSHDLSFFDRFASGRIVSRITSDTQDIGQMVTLVTDLVNQVVQMAILGVVLWRISPRLTLLMLGWAPTVMLLALGWRRIARDVTRQGLRAMAEVNAKIFETVAGIAVAKNFRRESTVYAEFDAVNRSSYRINVRRGFALATVFPALNALSGMGTAILVYVGGLTVIEGAIAVGAWFLFLQSLDSFWSPLMNMSAFWSQVQAGLSAIERVFALIDAEPAVVQIGHEPVDRLSGAVEFDHVCLRYDTGEVVLPDFSLSVAPGETLALVGHTGAGKSSVARLIGRLYEYQSGQLRIDGRDIRALDLAEYRRRMGIVPQVPFLFSGSVADNIGYGRPGAQPGEMESLASRIGKGNWLAALPDGLDTHVGERGSRLSMGQRQLVALLRVLWQDPGIFILDEATASIDPFTEAQIQEALELVLAGRTSIVIAHRLSTVRSSDRIVVMAGGRIIEQGTHDDLMARGGHYAELYSTYFRHQSPDYSAGAE